ncbi:MAG TPA: GIY-YIG nuclease family protein [Steroidobacteraceae bacterium]|nr:GIY-YIG nuclease family protein [Steroidobacteraceae bacterium]
MFCSLCRHTAQAGAQKIGAMDRRPAVYILASKRNGTLYVGVTSDLSSRVSEHKMDLISGFTRTHKVHNLVYYEVHSAMYDAIVREKRIKEWKRAWKLRLIESFNPEWRDLSDSL